MIKVLWKVLAIFLAFLTPWFVLIQCIQTASIYPIIKLLLMLIIVLLLFIVEGAEISVAALLDKDPEQVKDQVARGVLTHLQASPNAFLTGRELLAVALIVAFTLLSDSLSTVQQLEMEAWGILGSAAAAATSPKASAIFSFAISTFVILWFAQLLPKFLVHENPLAFFSKPVPQLLVKISAWLDKTNVGVVSEHAQTRLKKWNFFQGGPVLVPSRLVHYQNSATLRYGKGLEAVDITVRIGNDGHIKFSSSLTWKAFNVGVREFTEVHHWSSEIKKDSCDLNPVEFPTECGKPTKKGPDFSDTEIEGKKTPHGKVSWTLQLQGSLPVAKKFQYHVSYSTAPGACYTTFEKPDWYEWTVKTPTAKLQVSVLPDEGCGFSLTGGKCSVGLVAPENLEESARAKVDPLSGGYRYFIPFPLEGATYRFEWVVAAPLTRRSS